MAALARRGTKVGAAKVGPDFIDPGYHQLAAGRPSRNLDEWICGRGALRPIAAAAARDADLLVVEGVMGLFDGASIPSADDEGTAPRVDALPVASTASVAAELAAPVILVIDAAAISQSIAALVHGYATWHPEARPNGLVLNRVGSDAHEAGLRRALEPLGIPIVGCLRRDDTLVWRDRHLGLVPVVEDRGSVATALDRLAAAIERSVDLEAVAHIAKSAPPAEAHPLPAATPQREEPVRVAVAGGKAFSFVYPDNVERLQEAGADITVFDPLTDERLPAGAEALYAGGGFPEVYAEALAANEPLLADVRARAAEGLTVWAECGGLLWLSESLDGHRLAGVVPVRARMTKRLSLGYAAAEVATDNPLALRGATLRGHEFHYSSCDPAGDALELSGRHGHRYEGHAAPNLLATYLHLHLGAEVEVAERFVRVAGGAGGRTSRLPASP
jgi:cobyrinic acid a,c-diamide synthase